MKWKLYYLSTCSKCRAASELTRGIPGLEVVAYLETPPSMATLRDLARQLGKRPKEFLRQGEPLWASLGVDEENDEAVLRAMQAHPILIERPILTNGESAVVGRPPERITEFLAKWS